MADEVFEVLRSGLKGTQLGLESGLGGGELGEDGMQQWDNSGVGGQGREEVGDVGGHDGGDGRCSSGSKRYVFLPLGI